MPATAGTSALVVGMPATAESDVTVKTHSNSRKADKSRQGNKSIFLNDQMLVLMGQYR